MLSVVAPGRKLWLRERRQLEAGSNAPTVECVCCVGWCYGDRWKKRATDGEHDVASDVRHEMREVNRTNHPWHLPLTDLLTVVIRTTDGRKTEGKIIHE